MKTIEEICRVEGDHFVLDCCPRQNNYESPTPEIPQYDTWMHDPTLADGRRIYTFYLNIGFVFGMLTEKDSLTISCPICKEKYHLDQEQFFAAIDTDNKNSMYKSAINLQDK